MDKLIVEIFGRLVVELACAGISAAITTYRTSKATSISGSSSQHQSTHILSPLPQPIQHARAKLVTASSSTFGSDCERLVNIAFQTSRTFPSMMGTYADVSDYLRKELAKHYPNEHVIIIIGENHAFGFAIDDAEYLAELEQDLYRVLIFTAKRDSRVKSDTHDANSMMKFNWN